MQRPLGLLSHSSIVQCVLRRIRDSEKAWHRFWFEPADPILLGFLRLLTGGMLGYNLLVWTLDLEAFFSNEGLQPLATVRRLHETRFIFSFWVWIGDAYLWPMHFACMAIAAMFCAGLLTRITSVLSFLITISYSQRVPIANFGLDQILGMLCLYLALAPSGAALSLDSLMRRRNARRTGKSVAAQVKKSAAVRMTMRLIQLHLCAIYFWSGHAKLKGSTWWTGDAMWRVLANEEYQTLDLTWMAWVPWLPYLIAHVTVVWEVFFVVLVWNPRLRPLILLTGVMMHAGIGAFLGMWTFGLIMIFAYLAFLDPDAWRSRLNRFISRMQQRRSMIESSTECAESAADLTTSGISESARALTKVSAEPHPSRLPRGRLCIVACDSADRSAMRRYFREHQYDCRAVADPAGGLDVLSRHRFDAVLVNGTKLSTAALIDFTSDVADLTSLPMVLLLTPRQLTVVSEPDQIAKFAVVELPASLQVIRLRLEAVRMNPVGPESNPKALEYRDSSNSAADVSLLSESDHASE